LKREKPNCILVDKTAQINEQFEELKAISMGEKEYEARNGDLQADNEDFSTQNINPKEKLKSSSVARGELVQYYVSRIENLRQEYSAKLTKMDECFLKRKVNGTENWRKQMQLCKR
jgi:hypothetical protein